MRRAPIACLLAILATAAASCSGPPRLPAGVELATSLPAPSLATLEPSARQQVEERRERLAALPVGADPAVAAQALGELGMAYHAYQLLDAARACYQRAAELAPGELRWPYLLGQLELAAGQPAAAETALTAAARRAPGSVPAQVALAQAAQATGHLAAAAAALDAALALDPKAAFAHLLRGQTALDQGDLAAARQHLERARALQPTAEAVRRALVTAYGRAGDKELARQLAAAPAGGPIAFDDPLLFAVQSLAAGARAATERGAAAIQAGRYAEAESEFRQALAERPADADAHLNLGVALFFQGQLGDAEAALRRALELAPTNARAAFNLGRLLAARGDRQGAMAEYRQALASDPGFGPAHLNLGNALTVAGRCGEAAPHFRAVLASEPASTPARLGLAVCQVATGDEAAARASLEEGLRARPGDAALAGGLARVLAASRREGVRDGRRAVELSLPLVRGRAELSAVSALAMAYAEAGDFAQAIAWEEKALAAARQASRPDLADLIASRLALYRQGKPCREPWGEAELAPG